MDRLEDIELAGIVRDRMNEVSVEVSIDDL
jgi:hypothetical protein